MLKRGGPALKAKRGGQLSQIILEEFNNFLERELELPTDCLATVTKVEVTRDLKIAFIFLSVLPITKTGKAVGMIRAALGEAARYLSPRIKIRQVPKLVIKNDDTELKYREVEKELESL